MKSLLLTLLLAATLSAHAGRNDWQIGLQCWTLRGKTLLETIDYCAANGIKFLEIYPGQKLGDGFEGKSGHEMTAAECDKLKAILADKGVTLLSYGVVRAGPEEQWRPIFEFARRMGIKTIIEYESGNQAEAVKQCLDFLASSIQDAR